MKLVYGGKLDSNENIVFLDESDLKIPIGAESYSRPINFFKDLQDKKIEGKEIYKLFSNDDFSFWWFAYPTIFPSVNRTLNFITQFEKILEKHNPTILELAGEFEKWDLIKQICENKNIKFSYPKIKLKFFQLKSIFSNRIKKFYFSYIFSKKNKKRISIFKSKNSNFPNFHEKILFASATLYRRKNSDDDPLKNEYIQGPIMKSLIDMNYQINGIDVDYTFKGNFQPLINRLDDPISWYPLELILKKFSHRVAYSKAIEKFSNILNKKEFQSLFSFKGINFWEQVKYDFIKLTYSSHLPYYLEIIECFSDLFKTNKPRAIFIPYETGPIALALIIASKRNNIRTIGVQHGIIYDNHPDYSHSKFQNERDSFGMILPDSMLLFGKFSKDLLSKMGYPEEKLLIFGNPEFFNFESRLKEFPLSNLNQKYKIPTNKFIILFTSAKAQRFYKKVYGYINYDEQIWNLLLEKFGNDENFFLILKPHPSENVTIYEEMLSRKKVANAKIINGDLFEMIFLSSLVISIYSTTILDAICLLKPVIRVKFTETTPNLPYDEADVVYPTSLENLPNSILKLKNDHEIMNKLIMNGKKFAKAQYNIPNNNSHVLLKEILKS